MYVPSVWPMPGGLLAPTGDGSRLRFTSSPAYRGAFPQHPAWALGKGSLSPMHRPFAGHTQPAGMSAHVGSLARSLRRRIMMFNCSNSVCVHESSHWASSDTEPVGCTEPVSISIEQWDRHLDVLPPLAWVVEPGTESFRVHEPISGDIHLTLVRIGRKFYSMYRPLGESHNQLLARIVSTTASRPPRRRVRR